MAAEQAEAEVAAAEAAGRVDTILLIVYYYLNQVFFNKEDKWIVIVRKFVGPKG